MCVAVALVHCVVDVDDAGGLQHEGVLRHRLHHRRRVVRVDDHGVYLLVVATLEMKMFQGSRFTVSCDYFISISDLNGPLESACLVHLSVHVVAVPPPHLGDVHRWHL